MKKGDKKNECNNLRNEENGESNIVPVRKPDKNNGFITAP